MKGVREVAQAPKLQPWLELPPAGPSINFVYEEANDNLSINDAEDAQAAVGAHPHSFRRIVGSPYWK